MVPAAALAVALGLCTSAVAEDVGKNVVTPSRVVTKTPAKKKVQKYYIMTIASAIPQPIERYSDVPTTVSPVILIRRGRALP